MSTRLENILCDLSLASGMVATEKIANHIQRLLYDNNLDDDAGVPDWVIDLFERILAGEPTGWFAFSTQGYNYPDVFELFARLDEITDVRYEHREESITLTFPALRVIAEIWVESDQYRIVRSN
jgi:hypothetical protein